MRYRYRIKRVPMIHKEYDDFTPPWGLWDIQDQVYVNKYGEPDPDYWAWSRQVAEMRRRDLNLWGAERRNIELVIGDDEAAGS